MKFLLIIFSFFISLNAYELNGNLDVKWTGFKTNAKVGVPGTFKNIKFTINKDDSLTNFLKSANVEIDALSLDSKLSFRDKNITSTIFSLASAKTIKGTISSVDEENKSLTLVLTMNEVTKDVPMTYEIIDNKIVSKGKVEILDFALKDSFASFAKKCGALHSGKSYSDVDIEFTIPFK